MTSNPIIDVRNDNVPIQQPQQLELESLIVNINNLLDQQFPDPTDQQMQAPVAAIERPSIFYYREFSIADIFSYDPNGSRESKENNDMWKYVAFMTRWLGFDVRSYLNYMREKEVEVQSYYIEEVEIKILEGSHGRDNSDPDNQIRTQQFSNLSARIMQRSVAIKWAMLDNYNQIPWLAVEAVFTNSDLRTLSRIHRLAMSCFDDIYPGENKLKVQNGNFPSGGFKHLLHIFHWTRTPEDKFLADPQSSMGFYIPSATELAGSATDFKKIVGHCDVVYRNERLTASIQITTLHLYQYSRVLFGELLEFEQTYMQCGFPIAAYIACMDSLLKTEDDVKLLRKNGIVGNTLKDYKEVLDFVSFLRGRISCIPNDLISTLPNEVMKHHEKIISREYSDFKSQYCPNRWVLISVIAAFFLFSLSVFQAVHTAQGYFKTRT